MSVNRNVTGPDGGRTPTRPDRTPNRCSDRLRIDRSACRRLRLGARDGGVDLIQGEADEIGLAVRAALVEQRREFVAERVGQEEGGPWNHVLGVGCDVV